MLYGKPWIGVSIEHFIKHLDSHIKWNNEKQIMIILGQLSTVNIDVNLDYQHKFNFMQPLFVGSCLQTKLVLGL